ncbi:hypothetical protein K5549_021786, partial [Capra hircus]
GVPGGQTLEHLNPKFLEVNPAGKVPALRDGDFLLAESRKYQTEAHRYLPKLQARALVHECWEGWKRAGRLPGPRDKPPPLFLAQCLLPLFPWQPVDAVQVEQPLGKLTPALGHLHQELLAARPFLAPWAGLPGGSDGIHGADAARCCRLRPLPRLAPACCVAGPCGGCPGPRARPGGPQACAPASGDPGGPPDGPEAGAAGEGAA